MRLLILPLALILAAPATATQTENDRLLAAKPSGPPISCIRSNQIKSQSVVNPNLIVFKVGARYYRNDLGPGCAVLTRDRTIVTNQPSGTNICSGDIFQVVDLVSRSSWGGCVFGKFVPIEVPPRGK